MDAFNQVPPVLDKEPLVPTRTALGHLDPTGLGISHTSTLVQQTRSSSKSPPESPGTHPVLLHRCVADRMGSQLADPSALRTMVPSRVLTTYQLAGTGSDPIIHTSVGTSVAQSDCSSLLWQQHGSSAHSQTRGNSFHISVQQDNGIISSSGSVCDSSHPHPSSGSPECDSGRPAPDQQPQPYRMVASCGNLTQSVLCFRDPSSGHVRHRGEQDDPSLHFTLPGRQSMGSRRPLHILGRLRPNLCLPTSPDSSPNPPKDQVFPWHHSGPHRFPTPISTVAPSATSAQPSSSVPLTDIALH